MALESKLAKMLLDQSSSTLWYKQTPDEEHGEYPVETVMQWYNNHAIFLSARFSFDQGETWESIIDLRRRNGPTFPFIPKGDEEVEPGFGSIAAARKIVEATRAEVERLERERGELEKHVEEQEAMLERMKDMEKELDKLKLPKTDKYAQVEGRMFKVAEKLENENRAARQKPSVDPVVPQAASPPPLPRGRLFPMLQASTLPNDYAATPAILENLRAHLREGVPAWALSATVEMFKEPPTCSICPSSVPLVNLTAFLEHVLDDQHINNVTSTGGKITAKQVFYWKVILEKGTVGQPV